jgi:GDP-mannose 6-dehydrogenase
VKIAIFGLGYVGSVSAACFADLGHTVIGVDVDPVKVNAIAAGRSPVVEPGLQPLIEKALASGRLRASTNVEDAVRASDLSFVCVGTPSRDNGSLNLDYVERVAAQIGKALRSVRDYHVVVIRSTVLPGTLDELVIPKLRTESGSAPGEKYGVAMNPEFLREGTSVRDFHEPPKIIIGELDRASGDRVAAAYTGIQAPLIRTELRTAEMVKYADNAFHALKIAFANEVGGICKSAGIDARRVMDIFCVDTKLNISPAYLKPGSAFGGSCLPKDLRALVAYGRAHDVRSQLMPAILASNAEQKRLAYELVRQTGKKRVGILGLSFKADTDDLRESPAVELAETLIGKGYKVAIFDRNVALSHLLGANRAFIEREIPHINELMRDSIDQVIAESEVLVRTTSDREVARALAKAPATSIVVDLVGTGLADLPACKYVGICW